MKYRIELKAAQDIYIHRGNYWETAVMTDGSVIPGTTNRKEYGSPSVIPEGHGLAVFGTNSFITIPHFHSLIFLLTTDIFSDPITLADSLTFSLSRNGTDWQDILCTSPRIRIQSVHEIFYIVLTRL